METKNTAKLFVIILLFIAAAALAALNIYQHRQIQEAAQTTPAGTSQGNDSKAGLVSDNAAASLQTRQQDQVVSGMKSQTGDSELDELLYQLDAAEEELAAIREQVAADEAKKARQEELQKELSKRFQNNRESKEALKKSLDYQYADLYKKLNLSSEQIDEFKNLQAELMLSQQEVFSNYDVTGDLTEEEQKEMSRRYGELHEEYESKIEELLGETEYATYQLYSETQGERYRVNEFAGYLDSGESLGEAQKESLIEAMNEEQKFIISEMSNYTPEDYSNMSDEEKMELSLTNYNRTNEAYLKAANSVLSAAQLEKFEAYLEDEAERYRLIREMQALREDNSTGTVIVTQ